MFVKQLRNKSFKIVKVWHSICIDINNNLKD